jgi:hypothetical protein
MSCHKCGKYGHKRNNCPSRIAKIKCHQCRELGHYQNNCPLIKQQIQHDQKIVQRQLNDKLWLETNLPDKNMTLINKEELKITIVRAITNHFKLNTKSTGLVNIYYYDDILNSYDDNPLAELKGDFISLSYDVNEDRLPTMVHELNKIVLLK